MVSLPIWIVVELRHKVDFLDLIESLREGGLLHILEPTMNWDFASLAREVGSLVIANPLEIVMEADFFVGEEVETSGLVAVLLGKVEEILSIFDFGVGVVDDDALAVFDMLFGHLVALLFGFKSVAVDPFVQWHVVMAECRFAAAGAAAKDHHLFFNKLHIFVIGVCEQLAILGDALGVESLRLDDGLVSQEQVLRGLKLDSHIEGEFTKQELAYRSPSEKSLWPPVFRPAASPQQKLLARSALLSLYWRKRSHILVPGFLNSSSSVAMIAIISTPISALMVSIFFLMASAVVLPVLMPFWLVKITSLYPSSQSSFIFLGTTGFHHFQSLASLGNLAPLLGSIRVESISNPAILSRTSCLDCPTKQVLKASHAQPDSSAFLVPLLDI